LLDGKIMYIPAVMVYAGTSYANTEEQFWFPISTGCAAHVSYLRAVLAGIYEVIERDAISVVWLQKLALPRIELDYIPPELEPYWQRYESCLGDLEHHFFDATSDLGIPTVYCVQVAKHNPGVSQIVACSTGSSIVTAVAKVMRDTVPLRFALQTARKPPDEWDDFTDLLHGASYMCHPDSAAAFDFLLNARTRTKLDGIRTTPDEKEALHQILRILRQKKMQTYIVDLSTDEAIRCGMRVVRVIIPGLQPLSFRYRARFLGHPRLYEAPVSMGYRALPEQDLNHWPQPFA
jgi:ribosomal protein S12 methylthiotransferase accessory factor